jgi:uncharacterized membrane protein
VTSPTETPNSDDKLWSGLGYTGLICCMVPTLVIFLLKQGESNYIKFNCLQALGIGLTVFAVGIVLTILGSIPVIGFLVGIAHLLFSLACLAFWIYLLIQAFTGKEVRIPILAEFIDEKFMA